MDSFVELVLDQLRGLPGVTWRRMFGGYGFYSAGLFFAVVWDDRLYFKTDAAGEAAYRARGMGPFTYDGGSLKSLFEVPADVLEDAEQLTEWARAAVSCARAARLRKSQRPTKRKP